MQQKHDEAFSFIDKASKIPFSASDQDYNFHKEIDKLSAVTYNFGLSATENQSFEKAAKWLSASFEIARQKSKPRKKHMVSETELIR